MAYKISEFLPAILTIFLSIISIILIVGSIMFLKQLKAKIEIENQLRLNKLNNNYYNVIKGYAEIASSLKTKSSVTKLVEDDIAKLILRDLEGTLAQQDADIAEKEKVKQEIRNGE